MTGQGKAAGRQREFYETGITRDICYRKAALGLLYSGIRRREDQLLRALEEDLGKPACEEIGRAHV